MTEDKIMSLAARPEGFGVTWRLRDKKLMENCLRLARLGRLQVSGRLPGGGSTVFRLPGAAAPFRETSQR